MNVSLFVWWGGEGEEGGGVKSSEERSLLLILGLSVLSTYPFRDARIEWILKDLPYIRGKACNDHNSTVSCNKSWISWYLCDTHFGSRIVCMLQAPGSRQVDPANGHAVEQPLKSFVDHRWMHLIGKLFFLSFQLHLYEWTIHWLLHTDIFLNSRRRGIFGRTSYGGVAFHRPLWLHERNGCRFEDANAKRQWKFTGGQARRARSRDHRPGHHQWNSFSLQYSPVNEYGRGRESHRLSF